VNLHAAQSPQLSLFGAYALPRLSKSRFAAGVQCHKLLWWKSHEPGAVELQPDKVLRDRFDQGTQVGVLARERFPGGVLIDLPHNAFAERLQRTRATLDAGFPVIFEASFVADDTFVAIDVLERLDQGFRLIEVKSSSSQKDEHIADAAIQTHVARQNGIDIRAVEIMHLNKEFRFPDQGDLFMRTDVTEPVAQLLPAVSAEITSQLDALLGPLPDVAIGLHCFEPRACPFLARCWPQTTDHIIKLYNVGPKKACDYMLTGVHTIGEIPPKQRLPDAAKRQIRAMNENRLIVEPHLAKALEPFAGKLGFLDFETISRAVPVWPGMSPWEQAAAQFSYHEARGDGTYRHVGYLAEGPADARPGLAQAMLEATAAAERIVMYTPFERTRIRSMQQAVPELADELKHLEDKLIDLHPVIRDHVYHPDFLGSFSLKYVLHPLVPELTYNDLVIVDGLVASVEIARLLFVAQRIPPEERDRVRKDLLDYCERDTWAMVKLLERLRELARPT
jgi:predicted RecB family nuclease